MKKIAIWGGRFQPPHRGHQFIFEWCLERYHDVCISVVNPEPLTPPVEPAIFPRFDSSMNPLTFFQRQLAWLQIASDEGVADRCLITPAWHPRQCICIEETFLPPKRERIWIIPPQADEELMKIKDYLSKGEVVLSNLQVPMDLIGISGTAIRYDVAANRDVSRYFPTMLQDSSQSLVDGNYGNDREFVIVPILEVVPSTEVLQHIINLQQEGKDVVIALPVKIERGNEWWFKPSRDKVKYYIRAKVVRDVLSICSGKHICFVPIFESDDCFLLREGFIPQNVSCWSFATTRKSYNKLAIAVSHWGGVINQRNLVEPLQTVISALESAIDKEQIFSLHSHDEDIPMSKITISDNATINGPFTYVEGSNNKIENINALSEEVVRNILLLLRSNDIHTISSIGKHYSEISDDDFNRVKHATKEAMSESNKEEVSSIFKELSISASGSAIVSAIVEGLKLLM